MEERPWLSLGQSSIAHSAHSGHSSPGALVGSAGLIWFGFYEMPQRSMAESAAYHPRSATEIQREADRKEAERAAELIQFECRMQTKYKADFGRSYSDCRPTPARLSRSPL
jgi:hypothetical protein